MSKTLRRDNQFWMNNSAFEGFPAYGYRSIVKGVVGLKNRTDKTCRPGCGVCGKGWTKRNEKKKKRREARVDIAERVE